MLLGTCLYMLLGFCFQTELHYGAQVGYEPAILLSISQALGCVPHA